MVGRVPVRITAHCLEPAGQTFKGFCSIKVPVNFGVFTPNLFYISNLCLAL